MLAHTPKQNGLTPKPRICNRYSMPRRKRQPSMTELLREALNAAPSLAEIERRTGLKRQSLAKFMRGEQSLRLDLADILADYFGIESRHTRRGKG
jgi:transcriptional regulator with XRE-family HTH domain